MEVLYIAGSAFLGGVVSSLIGWIGTTEPFVPRKFLSSVIRGLIAGVVFAIGYQFQQAGVTIMDILVAFIAGAGADSLGNRIGKSI